MSLTALGVSPNEIQRCLAGRFNKFTREPGVVGADRKGVIRGVCEPPDGGLLNSDLNEELSIDYSLTSLKGQATALSNPNRIAMVYLKTEVEVRKENLCHLAKFNRIAEILDTQADGPLANLKCIKYGDGDVYKSVTYNKFRNMAYAAAQVYRTALDGYAQPNEENFVAVGYLSNHNKDYGLNLLALMALNVTPVILSPRNSIDILVHLLLESGTKVLVYEEGCKAAAVRCCEKIQDLKLIRNIVLEPHLAKSNLPTLQPFHDLSRHKMVQEHICLIMHSSGSTSYPKLIRLSHRYLFTAVERLRQDNTLTHFGTILLLPPMFHAFGVLYFLYFFFNGATTAFPRGKMPTPRQILADANDTETVLMACLPFQLKQMAEYCQENEDRWAQLSNVDRIAFAGAALSPAIGKLFESKGIILANGYGTTEVGILASSRSTKEKPGCRVMSLRRGVQFDLVGWEGDTAQLLIRADDPNLATGVSPPGEGYLVGDRIRVIHYDASAGMLDFEILGRVDDTIVHVTGEKTNPIPMENQLLISPIIDKCVILGSNRLNCCLFVQLAKSAATLPVNDIVTIVNRQVDEANEAAPSHSRIDPAMVYILPFEPTKLLPVTAKGNVSRNLAEKMFRPEMDELYLKFDSSESSGVTREMNFDAVSSYIKEAFSKVTKKTLDDTASFFSQGMDSLLAVKFRNLLNAAYPNPNLTVNSIYEMETVNALTGFILKGATKRKDLEYFQSQVDSFLEEYTMFPPATVAKQISKSSTNFLVTGANGSLGSFLIKALLEKPDTGIIFALARAPNKEASRERIEAGFQQRGIKLSDEQWGRIFPLPYTSDAEKLGLDEATYARVFNAVDAIYHVAWRMDFLKGLEAFRDCVESTVHLLKFCATSPRRPTFHFTSTIGATMPIATTSSIAEVRLSAQMKNAAFCNGYNLSKLVSENLCYRWADHFGFPLNIHRVGQVSGDTENGAWNTREHVSLLIKAAQVMEMIPSEFSNSVAWIPVDVAAKGMVDIHHLNPQNSINHIVNPHLTSWPEVVHHLKDLGIRCQLVDNATFLEALNRPQYQDVDVNPIASLTGFFTTLLNTPPTSTVMETQATRQRSKSIDQCPPVDAHLLEKYLRYWVKVGFLEPPRTIA
ncbi:hypothetical protein L0F63_006874 [Massospora cicadina]|nr:hypothetical protein L0F63_006874 [Massospora cicadina]